MDRRWAHVRNEPTSSRDVGTAVGTGLQQSCAFRAARPTSRVARTGAGSPLRALAARYEADAVHPAEAITEVRDLVATAYRIEVSRAEDGHAAAATERFTTALVAELAVVALCRVPTGLAGDGGVTAIESREICEFDVVRLAMCREKDVRGHSPRQDADGTRTRQGRPRVATGALGCAPFAA